VQVPPAFGGLADSAGSEETARANRETDNKKSSRGDLRMVYLALFALATYDLTHYNDNQGDEEHRASDDICFWWNSAS